MGQHESYNHKASISQNVASLFLQMQGRLYRLGSQPGMLKEEIRFQETVETVVRKRWNLHLYDRIRLGTPADRRVTPGPPPESLGDSYVENMEFDAAENRLYNVSNISRHR